VRVTDDPRERGTSRRRGGLYFLIAALLLALMTNVSAAWSLLVSLASDG
jgi:hypothetical protein